jgi:single-stranded-DNA-specific exonuclease
MKKQLSFLKKTWTIGPEIDQFDELQKVLLQSRDLRKDEEIQSFLAPSLANLHSPWELKDIKKAVERILSAIENQERIVVFGDFDVDGVTSTVILVAGLQELGAQVSYRIPSRATDSHGLKKHILDKIAEQDVKLIITCDCGMNDREEVSHASGLGIDVVITDHHEPKPNQFPDKAIAVVNPRQKNCPYPDKDLAGAGVAFKLISALAEKNFDDVESIGNFLPKFLELAAIGSIADCVNLTGENRTIAKFGLEKLKTTDWDGLRLLLEENNGGLQHIDEQTIGFVVAPRINASSRMGDVYWAVQLFLGDGAKHSQRLQTLDQFNEQRKELTQQFLNESKSQIKSEAPFQLFFHEKWEPGILGLVASRQSEDLQVPVAVCTIREDGTLTSSCRAPEGYNMIEGLGSCESLLAQYGGHRGAAGFVADIKNKDAIHTALETHFASHKQERKDIPVEAFISPSLINEELIEFLHALSPFGAGNREPIFGLHNLKITDVQTMGKERNHLRLIGKYEGTDLTFMAFFADAMKDQLKIGEKVDVLFTISENVWKGKKRVQLRVVDVASSK